MTDDEIIARVLRFEGGFVNNPLDRGGPTNLGITASELGRIRGLGRTATVAEKLQSWSDESAFTPDELLTWVTAYWATGTIGTSFAT